MFDRFNRRERIMIICLIIVGILALYYYFLYQPMKENLAFLEQQINMKKKQIDEYLVTIEKLPELRARYAELEYIENEALPVRITSVDEMLQVLEDESKKSGILITSFTPDEQENSTMISMLAEGNFEELVLFLDGIERLNGQIEFRSIRVFRKNQGDDSLNINAKLLFRNDLLIGGAQL